MRIPTLLFAEVHDDDPSCCGMCEDLFPASPVQCLRFGDKQCAVLQRQPETRRPLRCAQCLAAEAAYNAVPR